MTVSPSELLTVNLILSVQQELLLLQVASKI